jgi:hypothetical protein
MKKLILLSLSSMIIAGDFGGYSIFQYNDEAFDMKRVYLKYSNTISDDLSFKLTYDIGRSSDTHGSLTICPDNAEDCVDSTTDTKLSSYLKHAYINYSQSFGLVSVGVIGTNSYGAQEKTWGYRFIEKSPLDKAKWTNTADFGIGYAKSFGDINVSAQILNGEGYKKTQDSEGDFAVYLRLLYGEGKLNKNDGFNVGLVMTNHVDDQLVGLFGGWAKDKIRTGLEYNRWDAGSDSYVMLSNYLNYSLSDKWDVFVRNDRVEEIEISNTESNAYVGAVWKLNNNLHIAPHFTMSDGENDFRLSCIFKY